MATTTLARRPYDLRHAGISQAPSAGLGPADSAERAGNSVNVLLNVYAKCTDGKSAAQNNQIADALADDDEEGGAAESDRAQSFCMLTQKPSRWGARELGVLMWHLRGLWVQAGLRKEAGQGRGAVLQAA